MMSLIHEDIIYKNWLDLIVPKAVLTMLDASSAC